MRASFQSFLLLLAISLATCQSPTRGGDGRSTDTPDLSEVSKTDEIRLMLRTHCLDCHGDGADEGGFELERLDNDSSMVNDFDLWQTIRRRIHDMEMPPASSAAIEDLDRQMLLDWMDDSIRQAACDPSIVPPSSPLRRLTRSEYRNTIRDLLGIHIDASQALPSEGSGGEGFDNASEVLLISPLHAEKYLDAAKFALEYAARDDRARAGLLAGSDLGRQDGSDKSPSDSSRGNHVNTARETLSRFVSRAYRRPVGPKDVDPLVRLYRNARETGASFESACFYAMQAALISPHFLFRVERGVDGVTQGPLSDHELAVRLSYFLWESMPDEALREVADAGELKNPERLREQTVRMLQDGRLRDAALSFTSQWLGTAELGRTIFPDPELYPWIDEPVRAVMRDQPGYVFDEILRTDASLLELIDSKWTFLNTDLLKVYSLSGKDFEENIRQRLVRVTLPQGNVHGSLLAMSAVMAVASYPKRTSPVLRGAWVLDNLLGSPPPPPPADVPELDEAKIATGGMTLREQFEIHRSNPTCASCHDRLDPIGFALENLDMIGRWRTEDAGGVIDASATLPNGTAIDGIEGLKQYLMSNRDAFVEQLARKLLGFALGRGLEAADFCALDHIVERVRQSEYRSHELILAIVESEPFLKKR